MVLFEWPEPLTPDALKAGWRAAWPNLPTPTDFDSDEEDEGNTAMTFRIDRMTGAYGMVAARIPGGDLEAAATTSYLWPNAGEELPRAEAHAIVWVSGRGSQVDAYTTLTQVLVAIINATGALAAYFGAATHVIQAEVFDELARLHLDEDRLPAHLWIDFRVYVDAGRWSLVTYGMKDFGLKEIEIRASRKQPQELREFAINIACYLLREGPVIRDGDTVGESDQQRVRVRRTSSLVDRPGFVYRLEGL